jgi:hypothetical protein
VWGACAVGAGSQGSRHWGKQGESVLQVMRPAGTELPMRSWGAEEAGREGPFGVGVGGVVLPCMHTAGVNTQDA